MSTHTLTFAPPAFVVHDMPPLDRLLFLDGPCHGLVGKDSNFMLNLGDPPTAEGYTRKKLVTIFGTTIHVGIWHTLTTLEGLRNSLSRTKYAVAFGMIRA